MADSLKDGLLVAKPGSKEFIIAQARTVTAFQSLDKKRQSLLIQYLTGAGLNYASIDLKKDKNGNVLIGTDDRVLLYRARMVKIDLKNSDLSSAVLIGANLSAANLGCVPLDSKERRHCSDLRETDLRDANLSDADLSNANLSSADLSSAILSSADLSGANLSSAILTDANLYGADLSSAILTDANLYGADLSGAFFCELNDVHPSSVLSSNILPEQIKTAKNWETAFYTKKFRAQLGLPPSSATGNPCDRQSP